MSNQLFSFQIEPPFAGERLDRFLVSQLPNMSRSAVQRLIKEDCVRVNSASAKPNHAVRVGEKISVTIPEPHATEVKAEDISLDVLFEDNDLLVINKPPGMTVHPGAGNPDHTLVNALLHHCGKSLSGIGGELRPGIVHRLDKDTSGCMVVAKNDAAHQALSAQFQSREVSKVYLALVEGRLKQESGVINAAIARHRVNRQKMQVDELRGRHAVTDYKIAERFAEHTLVEAAIHTGRTHQIRVHLAHLGYPILGDETYGRRTPMVSRFRKAPLVAKRQMLHSWKLGFTHPRTKKAMQFEAPISADMAEILAKISEGKSNHEAAKPQRVGKKK